MHLEIWNMFYEMHQKSIKTAIIINEMFGKLKSKYGIITWNKAGKCLKIFLKEIQEI